MLLLIVSISTGCTDQGNFSNQAFDRRWTNNGFSIFASQPWIKAGFDPDSASLWRSAKFTAQQAAAWQQVKSVAAVRAWMEDGFSTPEEVTPWLRAFSSGPYSSMPEQRSSDAARLRDAGISPAEVLEFTAAGMSNSDIDGMRKVKALLRESGSVEKALIYSKAGVSAGGVAAYEQRSKLIADRLQEATKPCKSLNSEALLITSSPYSIVGKCFQLSPLQIVQWLDKETVLATSPYMAAYMSTPFYIEAKDLQHSFVPAALVIGDEPTTYQAVSGARQTAFHMRVLAWEEDLKQQAAR
jgi:hypothetical protein